MAGPNTLRPRKRLEIDPRILASATGTIHFLTLDPAMTTGRPQEARNGENAVSISFSFPRACLRHPVEGPIVWIVNMSDSQKLARPSSDSDRARLHGPASAGSRRPARPKTTMSDLACGCL